MKSRLTTLLTATILACSVQAQDKKSADTKTNTPPKIKTDVKISTNAPSAGTMLTKEKVSYAVGMFLGNNQLKRSMYEFNVDEVVKGLKDSLSGAPTKMTEAEVQEVIQKWQVELRAKHEEEMKVQAVAGKKEGEAFLTANAKKAGVKTKKVTLPDGKTSELQYKVITEGTGKMPKSSDTIVAEYAGRLVNGTEFDSSKKHGKPLEVPVGGVIKGWTEALLMMKTGAKWELYIPAELAYGDQGRPGIPPNSTLIFEMELKDIKPAPEETVHAVSGEIIKVPSADGLKKGEKIEVIKPDQTNSAAKTNSTKLK